MSNKPKRIREKITKNYVDILRSSNYFQLDFKSSLNQCLNRIEGRISSIICYGLGSFCDGVQIASRYQLALLILIHEYLVQANLLNNLVIDIYDPSFEEDDKATLISFKNPPFKIIPINEHCSRVFSSTDNTLIYMPHLDKHLYNNLIGSNWNSDTLKRMLVLGNSFREMVECETESSCKTNLYYIYKLVSNFKEFSKEVELRRGKKLKRKLKSSREEDLMNQQAALIEIPVDDSTFDHQNIFNSLSFHLVCNNWIEKNVEKLKDSILRGWIPTTSANVVEDSVLSDMLD